MCLVRQLDVIRAIFCVMPPYSRHTFALRIKSSSDVVPYRRDPIVTTEAGIRAVPPVDDLILRDVGRYSSLSRLGSESPSMARSVAVEPLVDRDHHPRFLNASRRYAWQAPSGVPGAHSRDYFVTRPSCVARDLRRRIASIFRAIFRRLPFL